MRRFVFLTYFVITCSPVSFAQSKTGAIRVRVIDVVTKKDIPNALVRWKDERYEPPLPPGMMYKFRQMEDVAEIDSQTHRALFTKLLPGSDYDVRASSFGNYAERSRIHVNVEAGKTTSITLELSKVTMKTVITKNPAGYPDRYMMMPGEYSPQK